LYKTLEITLDKSWLPLVETQLTEELLQASLDSEASFQEGIGAVPSNLLDATAVGNIVGKKVCSLEEEDALHRNWDEVGEFASDGVADQRNVSPTMLDQLNSAEEFLNQALIVAPVEGMTPISLFWTSTVRRLAFQTFIAVLCVSLKKAFLFVIVPAGN
jgi:hypothetical protein